MDRILVLTVDRDDDLGNKTSIRGPVVNRRNVLTAALKLGMADPEESDTNAILGAHIVGHGAEEIIHLFAMAMKYELGTAALSEMVYAYPTFASDIKFMV